MKQLYYLLVICLLGCKKELKEKVNSAILKPQNKNIKITGTSDEKGFDKRITFYDDSFFREASFKYIDKEIRDDTISRVLKNIRNPKLLEFNSFGENTFYNTRIIVTPGDSVNYKLKKGKLEFFGKNKEHYNFYLEMDPEYDDWTKLYLDKYNPNFKKYKRQCDSLYQNRLTFFNYYIKKNPKVSAKFKKIIQNDLQFEYLVNVIRPRSEKQGSWNINTSEDLISIYERGDRQEGEFFDINSYLNNISIEDINQPEYVNNLYFKMSIVPLIRQYFVKSNETPYSVKSFEEELTFLKKNFNQSIVDYATGKLIVDYFNQGFGKDRNTSEFMKKTIKVYKESIKDSSTLKAITDIEQELSSINKVVPKDLRELVLNLSKDTVDLNYILRKNKIKIIDFWASWCQPCIREIIVSKEIRENITKKYNVEFINLSVDRDSNKWIDKSINLHEYLFDSNQYKILNLKKSKFIKYLNIKSSYGLTIPRYIILDNHNKIIDNNAPKPSNQNFTKVLDKYFSKEL